MVEKDSATKEEKQRLSVLEMAETLGNISAIFLEPRQDFMNESGAFRRMGGKDLKDMPSIPKSQPNQTTPETKSTTLKCSLTHPSLGYVKLLAFLKLQGVSVSFCPPWLKVEERHLENGVALIAEQIAKIKSFKERHVESVRSGDLLCQDTVCRQPERRQKGLSVFFYIPGKSQNATARWFRMMCPYFIRGTDYLSVLS